MLVALPLVTATRKSIAAAGDRHHDNHHLLNTTTINSTSLAHPYLHMYDEESISPHEHNQHHCRDHVPASAVPAGCRHRDSA